MSQYNSKTTGSQLVDDLGNNIKGKTVLVTGVTPKSIGARFVLAIAKASPRLIILAGRNTIAAQKTAEDLGGVNNAVGFKILGIDLSSFRSVREAATQVNSWIDVPAIDVLVNNAGIMATEWAQNDEGIENQLATNHLGPWLFTNLIMNKLLASGSPRVVIVGSFGHRLGAMRWGDYNFGDGKHYNKWRAYGQSKTASNLMAISLAAKLGDRGLQSYSLHPGVTLDSNITSHLDWAAEADDIFSVEASLGNKYLNMGPYPQKNDDEIIATHIYASFTDDLKVHNGAYLQDCQIADQYNDDIWPWAKDPVEADRLWRLSEKLVKEKFPY